MPHKKGRGLTLAQVHACNSRIATRAIPIKRNPKHLVQLKKGADNGTLSQQIQTENNMMPMGD